MILTMITMANPMTKTTTMMVMASLTLKMRTIPTLTTKMTNCKVFPFPPEIIQFRMIHLCQRRKVNRVSVISVLRGCLAVAVTDLASFPRRTKYQMKISSGVGGGEEKTIAPSTIVTDRFPVASVIFLIF